MNLDEVADELYRLPLSNFTDVRARRAGEAAAAGDSGLGSEIRKLRKPSQAAWWANRLAHDHRQAVEELLSIGRALRRAQAESAGDDIRALSVRRLEAVGGLMKLAAAEGRTGKANLGPVVQRQLMATLEAAVADEESGSSLMAGRLTEALSHIGFGVVDVPATSRPRTRGEAIESRRAHSKVVVRARKLAVEEAEHALAQAESARAAAQSELRQAQDRRDAVKAEQRRVAKELATAEKQVDAARRRFGETKERRDGATRKLRAVVREAEQGA